MAQDFGVSVDNAAPNLIFGDHPKVFMPVSLADGQDVKAGQVMAKNSSGLLVALALEAAVADEVVGAGTGSLKVFQAVLANPGAAPGTVVIAATVGAAGVQMTDDGKGRLSGDDVGVGSVDYGSGLVYLVFETAPDNSTNVTASYSHDQGGTAKAAAVMPQDLAADGEDEPVSVPVHATVRSDALIWPESITDGQKARAKADLAKAGIYLV